MQSATDAVRTPGDGQRILCLDVLRGFALFGIFYAHMIFWYAGGPLEQHYYQGNQTIASGLAAMVYMVFVIAKFFALFSFLFGLSFYIQLESLARRVSSPLLHFAWRLAILGVIGFLHHLFWRADILSIYVLLGFVLIFLRHMSDRALLIVGMVLVLNLPNKLAELVNLLLTGRVGLIPVDLATESAEYTALIRSGGWGDIFIHNLGAFSDKFIHQINSGRLLITLGYFLLGVYAGRKAWFSAPDKQEHFRWLRRKSLAWIGLVVLAFLALGGVLWGLGQPLDENSLAFWALGFFCDIYNTALVFLYIAVIYLLMSSSRGQRWLRPLADVGKMALTVYLMQSVIGVLLFFQVGLGLFDQTTPAVNVLLCLVIFAGQLLFCRVWLRYFAYGPVEWLWRSATERRWQVLRCKMPEGVSPKPVA